MLKKLFLYPLALLALVVVGFNLWGLATQGKLEPAADAAIDRTANRVVVVLGATGSVGEGLLKAATLDPDVSEIHVITRRSSPRIDAGVASGRVTSHLHRDFTDYSAFGELLARTNTVLWGLGTTSIGMDDATYTRIHVDFPMAFINAWLSARQDAPMAFHFVTGMGTDPEGGQHWAREKVRTEREMAAAAEGTGLRTFSYRSGFIRPAAESAGAGDYIGQWLFRPGSLAITGLELGQSMLEISARIEELPNGTLVDNADTIAYARAYAARTP